MQPLALSRRGLVAIAALALASPPALAGEPPTPRLVDHLHAEGDFIDDPFALSDDGTRIAWITTDGATHSRVHLAAVGSAGAKGSARDFAYSSITPERVDFLDAERVIVIERNPETGMARGQVYGPSGAARDKFGPATDIALAVVGGTPAIVTYTKSGTRTFTHTLATYRRDNLRPLAKKVLVENGEGRVTVPGGAAKPLFFEDGYAVLVAQKEGAYDKAHDIRKPDAEARVEVFSGKLVTEREIKDVVAFAELQLIRKRHQNERNFVRFSDDLKRFELVDADDVITELQTPRPLGKYDPQTLAFQSAGRGALDVSLTVDPVNPEAVKAQKADKDWLDVYHLDVKERKLTEVARVDGQKRATAWRLAGGRLGVLRKHKGFGRGGEELEIFDVGPEKPAVKAKAAPGGGDAKKVPADAKSTAAAASGGAEKKAPADAKSAGAPASGGGGETTGKPAGK